jgi:hypothetical protein
MYKSDEYIIPKNFNITGFENANIHYHHTSDVRLLKINITGNSFKSELRFSCDSKTFSTSFISKLVFLVHYVICQNYVQDLKEMPIDQHLLMNDRCVINPMNQF